MLAIYSKVARRFSLSQRSHSFQFINGLPSSLVDPSHFLNGGGSDGITKALFLQSSFPSQTRNLGDYAEGETTDELWLSVLSTNSGAAGSSPALTVLLSRLANFPHVARIGPQRTLDGVLALQDYALSLGLRRHWFFDDSTAAALIARFPPQVLAWRLTQIRETIWGHLDDLSPDHLRERYLGGGTHVGGEGRALEEASVGTPDGGKLRLTLSPQLREGPSASTSLFPHLSHRRDLLDHIALDLIEKSARLRALAGEDVLVSVLLKSIPELLHRNVDELCVSHHRDGEWVSIVSTHDGNGSSAVSNSSVTMTHKGFRKISESSQDSAGVVSMAADVKAGGAMIQRYGNVLLVNLNPEKHVVVIGRMGDEEAMEKGVKEVGRGGDDKRSRQADLKKDVGSKGDTVIRVFRRKKQARQGVEQGDEGRGEGGGGRVRRRRGIQKKKS
uniref:Uncharacterized protein n=1 Tax=Polytomella parva TaxID=51329 RepID=A0A7S0VBT1_9CHLO|mmetsp:Transcript_2915/g.4637  ORF Transcript_2915/g.4637 Transcript_2915/m.4637 type:complete len:444 (+) Transcript_2915:210-1541(+)